MASERLYCHACRRYLVERRFDIEAYYDLDYQFCRECEETMVTIADKRVALDGEVAISDLLWKAKGGDREVLLGEGLRADLVTEDAVYEVKHVNRWPDAVKVLLYAQFLPGLKPRVYLFGRHTKAAEDRITEQLGLLGIEVEFHDKAYGVSG